jgi:hypothetical protein
LPVEVVVAVIGVDAELFVVFFGFTDSATEAPK